jgi:hypothetical protein
VRLRRQAGLTKPNLHSVLQGPDSPEAPKRRPIVVDAVTRQGKRVVGCILAAARQPQPQQQQETSHEQQQQQQQQQQPLSELPPGQGPSGVVPGRTTAASSSSEAAAAAFMFRLAELQSWRKKHGSCCVPLDVFDAPQLSHWVASLRTARQAAAGEAAAGVQGDGAGTQEQEPQQQEPQQQEPQQEQQEQLPGWQIRELNAVGFLWRRNQVGVGLWAPLVLTLTAVLAGRWACAVRRCHDTRVSCCCS